MVLFIIMKRMRRLYASIGLFLCTCIIFIGAELFTKASLLIFMVLIVSLAFVYISILTRQPDLALGFTGFSVETFLGNFWTEWKADAKDKSKIFDYQYLVAILFPAASGMFGGVNMSGNTIIFII
jgi:hypothetical protein